MYFNNSLITYDVLGKVTCDEEPCENSGTCIDDPQLGFQCLCHAHYKGLKCQEGETTLYTVQVM